MQPIPESWNDHSEVSVLQVEVLNGEEATKSLYGGMDETKTHNYLTSWSQSTRQNTRALRSQLNAFVQKQPVQFLPHEVGHNYAQT